MLEETFFKWYKKSHFLDINYKSIKSISPKKNDVEFLEEYLKDLSRFELELSQIDELKLNSENYIQYRIIFKTYFSLYNNIEDPNIMMDEKIDTLFVIINQIIIDMDIIKSSQKKIYSDTSKFNNIVKILTNYIDTIPIKVNSNEQILDKIDSKLNNLKKEIFSFKKSIFSDLISVYDFYKEKNHIYFDYFLSNYPEVEEYKSLEKDYKLYINKIFNLSLIIYNHNNDEPIWVDEQDTLDVIQWVVDNKIKITTIDKKNVINAYYKALNNINISAKKTDIKLFANKLPSFRINDKHIHLIDNQQLYSFDDIILNFDKNDYVNNYVMHNNLMYSVLIQFLYKEKYYNDNKLRYSLLDESFIYGLSHVLNEFFILEDFYKNDSIYLISHYLEIIKEIVKAQNQYDYFKNKYTKNKIMKSLEKYAFYNSKESNAIYDDIITMNEIFFKNYIFYKNLLNLNNKKSLNKFLNDGYLPISLLKK